MNTINTNTSPRITDPEFRWTRGVATDVLATFRRFGWTPPSERPEYQAKWDRHFPQRHNETR